MKLKNDLVFKYLVTRFKKITKLHERNLVFWDPCVLISKFKMAAPRQKEEDYEKPRKIPRTLKEKDSGKRLIVVIEKASLEAVKVSWNIFRLSVKSENIPKLLYHVFVLIVVFRMVKTSNY